MKKVVNLCNNLLAQADKIYKHTRQKSYETRKRYYEAFKRFLQYLATYFSLQKIANIKAKHIYAYVEYMKEKGLSASTMKTDLAAIRFWQDQIPNADTNLPTNEDLEIEDRSFGKIDRSWTLEEIALVISELTCLDKMDYAEAVTIARYSGLRISEIFRLDTAICKRALKSGILTIQGKGGKKREIPLAPETRNSFERMLNKTPVGEKLFVAKDDKTHLAIARFQNFIGNLGKKLFPDREIKLTTHGLRHTYAVRSYQKLLAKGYSAAVAKRKISKWLGHERPDVTNIYLASLNKDTIEQEEY